MQNIELLAESSPKHYLFGSIFLLSNKLQLKGDKYLHEITMKQWFLLTMIRIYDKEQASVTEIASFIGSTRQNVRKMLEVLSDKGYVTLTQNPRDKRNLSVSLTEQTLKFFIDFDNKGEIFLDQVFDGIDNKQVETCAQVFTGLFENIERLGNIYE